MIISEHYNEKETRSSKVYKNNHSYMIELYEGARLLGRIPANRAAKAEDLAEEWVLNKLNIQEITKL